MGGRAATGTSGRRSAIMGDMAEFPAISTLPRRRSIWLYLKHHTTNDDRGGEGARVELYLRNAGFSSASWSWRENIAVDRYYIVSFQGENIEEGRSTVGPCIVTNE